MADPSPIFNYRYPLTKLTDSDDYLKISIFEYIPPGFIPGQETFALPSSDTVGYGDKVKSKGTIILPIPDGVQDTNNATWGDSSFNPLEGAVAAGVQGLYQSKSTDDAKNKFLAAGGKIMDAAKTGAVQKYLKALGIGLASNILLGSENKTILSRFSGQIVNSNVELIFTSVNIRAPFTFVFDIVPRSEKEAKEVKEIIRALKKHSAAKKSIGAATGLFLKAPDVFKIEYMNGSQPHPFLNKFKICALQGMSVNYNPSGTYATYSDATPVNMTLTVQFQELTPIYAEDYTDNIGGTGY